MYAIIETGGKQYKVKAGDELHIERLEHAQGKPLRLDKVLLVAKEDQVTVGRPHVKGAYAEAELLQEVRGPKTISFKYIRREKSATKKGHRQNYLKVKIKSVHAGA